MRNWLLHHTHFAIFVDSLIHSLIVVACLYLFLIGYKFVQAVKASPGATPGLIRFSYFFYPIAIFMTICAASDWYWCIKHYSEWWNR